MNKLQYITLLFLLMCFSQIGLCIEHRAFPKLHSVSSIHAYEQPPQIIKSRKGRVTDLRVSDDFISGISHYPEMKFKDKRELLSTLELMLSDKENTAKQVEMFRQIEQSELLTSEEKVIWLKPRINKLPAPFTMLLAKFVAPTNLDEAFKWKVLSQLRMKIDATKCKDQSVYEGINLIELYYLDSFFDIMVAYYGKHGDVSKLTNEYINDEFNRRNLQAIKAALQYHSAHAYQLQYPYWLNNHGMNHLKMVMKNHQNPAKKDVFITALDSRNKEKQLIAMFQQVAKTL